MNENVDLSILQDFKMNVTDSFTNWDFNHEEYQDIPLSFFNKFIKNIKYSDLSAIPPSKEDTEFVVVEGNLKKKNKNFISKNERLTDRKQPGNLKNTRIFSKKESRLRRWYENANKTKFKEITVKSQWLQIQTINKAKLDSVNKNLKVSVEHIKTIGNLNQLNPKVERIAWKATGFTQNKTYEIQSASTIKDQFFNRIAAYLSQQQSDKIRIICSPEFLFALMTVRASIYPWTIQVQKQGNLIVLDNFKENEEVDKLTYLDLFTTNENTNNSMASDESKVKEFCMFATKMTKVFQELLASGEEAEIESEEQNNPYDDGYSEEEEEESKEEKEKLNRLIKYVKITLGKYQIYTKVRVDGAKKNFEGEFEQYLIRTFIETQTQGAWMKDMKTSSGTIITKQYQSNNCSLQKWMFEAQLAGVRRLKLGYIGYDNNNKNRPVLLNVSEVTVEGLEQTLSVKMDECWGNVKYLFDKLKGMQSGTFLMSKGSYTPLTLKLFKISASEEIEEIEEEEEGEDEEEEKEEKSQEGEQSEEEMREKQ